MPITPSQTTEATAAAQFSDGTPIEVSVVMPCLNEHETVGTCVRKAVAALRQAGISGEVITADNGMVRMGPSSWPRRWEPGWSGCRCVAMATR